jgi:pimeloyl-ACP methyl ester carboxylesterase
MSGQDTRKRLARCAESLVALKPLMAGLADRARVVPMARDATVSSDGWSDGQWSRLGRLLDSMARDVGVAGLTLSRNGKFDDLPVFERVISRWLALVDWMACVEAISMDDGDDGDEVRQVVVDVLADSFDAFARKTIVASFDGIPLNVYAAGRGDETVVLVPACGMPVVLAESWIRFLARNRRVLTWESRGLFGAVDDDREYATSVSAQVADLYAVMDHGGVRAAHVIGLCDGAVVALAAAAERPERVASLSLWHGAYGFADGGPVTKHQEGLIELTTTAGRDRDVARSLHSAFCQIGLTDTPADVAHLVLYPYARPELFYRYCRLNTGITSADVGRYLGRVRQPTLVVTSADDAVAHPDGSRRVATGLPDARLRVETHGDHISLFSSDPLMRVADDFIAQHPSRQAKTTE